MPCSLMKEENIKLSLERNKEKLPLYFNDAICKSIVDKDFYIYSQKYKDADYRPYKFYKPITQF